MDSIGSLAILNTDFTFTKVIVLLTITFASVMMKSLVDSEIKQICNIIVYTKFRTTIKKIIYKIKNCMKENYNLTFQASFYQKDSTSYADVSIEYKAICFDVIENKKLVSCKFYDRVKDINNHWSHENKNELNVLNFSNNLLVDCEELIKINDDIHIIFRMPYVSISYANIPSLSVTQYKLSITSTSGMESILKYVAESKEKYENHVYQINRGKLYHFIFNGYDDVTKSYVYTKQLLSDSLSKKFKNYQAIDNMFSPNTEIIERDMLQLKDVAYYQRTGQKHKKGYLFYGKKGCGKTSMVTKIALQENRHILEVNGSYIKTKKDVEEILSVAKIDDVNFDRDQLIIFMDEIDKDTDLFDLTPQKEVKEKNKEDEINLDDKKDGEINYCSLYSSYKPKEKIIGLLLSRIDGIGLYSGLIIIVTCNDIKKIPSEFYRHGRLDPIYFDLMNSKYIIKMIEKNYGINLNDIDPNIKKLDGKIAPSTLRYYLNQNDTIETFISQIDVMLEEIKKLKDETNF